MSTLYAKISTDWNNHFVGYSALAIIVSTCLGSIAVMLTMMDGNAFPQMFQVFLVVAACNAHNAAILTVQKPKTVLNLLIVSILVSVLVMFASLLY